MKTKKTADPTRPYSSIVFDGDERAAARAMLYPVGFKPEDFKKPLIGIASTWGQVTPCNMHIDKLALEAEAGANDAGGKAIIFNTITISDGISMGSEGMKYSLVSREVIADSIETVVGCAGMDGFVAIGGCDKNMPGSMIAIARLNRPAVFVYGGTILPGCITGDSRKLDIVSVFEAIGAHANKKIGDEEFQAIEQCAIPGPGSCGGMYTANTMASAVEALGMSLPNSSAQNAMSKAKIEDCRRAGAAVVEMLRQGIRPLDILTKKAFENAITVVIALSGSTREVTEGATALIAAVILLYVGFWMYRKAYADRWGAFLQGQLRDTLSARTRWALALVSFLAVYREAFEIVLFYQALWLQAAPAYAPMLGGLCVAAVALTGLGWLILRGTVHFPLGPFFGATSILLVLLAVIFVGKGIATLQEAGTLPVHPESFPGIPTLGVYPNLLGLLLQAGLMLIIASVFIYTYYSTEEA